MTTVARVWAYPLARQGDVNTLIIYSFCMNSNFIKCVKAWKSVMLTLFKKFHTEIIL